MEKMSTNTTQDRISALPDPVLVHILSFLDMKQVAKTSILSKRWQCTWTKVPTLTFAYHDFTEREIGKFVVWVNRTLLRCWNTSIEKFKVDFRYLRCFASDVDDWVRFAAEKQVRDLNLRLHSSIEAYSLPKSVCSNSSLTNLSLCGCQVASWRDLHWSSLKSLSIAFMELNSDIIEKILSGSPMLEYLKITHSWGIHHLYITSANPKELVIDSGHVSDIESPMEISAPNIQSLHILGHFRRQFRLMSVSSLLRAKLNFSLDDKDNSDDNEQQQCSYIIQLLLSIHHVGELELGMWCIRALLFLEANALPSPLSCLTRLKLNANVDKHDLPGVISLLKSSPNLEEFVVKKECDDLGFLPCSEFVTQQRNNYWISRMRMENFPLPHHLKTLKFHGFKKLIDFDGFTLTLVQVLLEKAELLGNIVISSTKEGYQMLVMPRVA